MQLLIASNNSGKIQEVKQILHGLPLQVVTPVSLAEKKTEFSHLVKLKVAETGLTYQDNALLKAQAFGKASGIMAIADDSGLEVKALNNFPGVQSNRWSPGTDAQRNSALLKKLKNIQDRSARFVTLVCLFKPQDNSHYFFEGQVYGQIASLPAGMSGFGYDPIFIPDGYKKTFAQLGISEKNKLSHRWQALTKLKEYLITQL